MEFGNLRNVDDAYAADDQEPVLALLGFFDDDAESGDELSSRASVAGSAIVGTDRRCTFRQLI
jgi:hypothetical protein